MDKPRYELAESDYINGMKYKDIAEKHSVSINTVKSWKTRYKWNKDKKGMYTNKKVCIQNKDKKVKKKELIVEEEKEVLENTTLTDKQKLFCSYYVKYRNKTKAYMKAYNCSYDSACSNASTLWKNRELKKEIDRQLNELRNIIKIDILDLIQLNIDIAFADIKDYVEFGNKEVDYLDNKGNVLALNTSFVEFKNSDEVDGTIISEVKKGKDGVSIKLQDKMKAIDFLARYSDKLDTATRIKLDNEQKKLDYMLDKNNQDNSQKDDVLVAMLEGLKNGI